MSKNIMITMLCIILMIFIFPIEIHATTINPDNYRPEQITEADTRPVAEKFGIIVSAIRTVGMIVTVVVLLILGIKYMAGSITERADYKKSMIPYLIGVIIFFALSQVLSIVIELAGNI